MSASFSLSRYLLLLCCFAATGKADPVAQLGVVDKVVKEVRSTQLINESILFGRCQEGFADERHKIGCFVVGGGTVEALESVDNSPKVYTT